MAKAGPCLTALLLLASCASKAPPKPLEYIRPESIIPASFPNIPPEIGQDVNLGWSDLFLDKNLQRAIKLSLENNRNLRIAAVNIERASAQLALVNSNRIPIVSISSAASSSQTAGQGSNNSNSQNFGASFGFSSFELDMFGKLKANSDAARENYFVQSENRVAIRISVVSQTALGWLAVIADKQALSNARKTQSAWQNTLALVSARRTRGLASDLDETAIRIQLRQTEADILTIESRIAQNKALLFSIVGEQIRDDFYDSQLEYETLFGNIPTNLSSTVLLNRPDIMAAEHNLIGSRANIIASRAAFFPRINISTGLGVATRDLSNLFNGGAFAYNLAGNLTAPIFDNGTNQANYSISVANQKSALHQYENSIISAFSECWSALSFRSQINERLTVQRTIVNDSQKALLLVEARFTAGLDSYLPLLAARRTLYNAEQNLVALEYLKAINSVAIYRAIGADRSIRTN